MSTALNILEHIDFDDQLARFVKSSFLDCNILMDTWTGMINATKFCAQSPTVGKSSFKNFHSFIASKENKSCIIEDYSTARSQLTRNEYEYKYSIYNTKNKLYVIDGKRDIVKTIGGTYVYYHSLLYIATWCDMNVSSYIYEIVTLLHNYLNSNIKNDSRGPMVKPNATQQHTDTSIHLSALLVMQQIFPHLTFSVADEYACRYGNIVVKTDSNETTTVVDLSNNPSQITIILTHEKDSKIDLCSRLIVIHKDDIQKYTPLLLDLFTQHGNEASDLLNNCDETIDLFNEFITSIKCPTDSTTMVEEISALRRTLDSAKQERTNFQQIRANLVNQLSVDIDMAKTANNIEKLKNTHLRKKRYQQIYADGKLNLLPPALIAFVPKT